MSLFDKERTTPFTSIGLLSFNVLPWFKEAKVASVLKVKLLHGEHVYWPDLDVDLELESLKHPEKYPLTYRPTA